MDFFLHLLTPETTAIGTKKVFDAYMSSKRTQEEKLLIVREMRQHCRSLRRRTENLRTLISQTCSGGNSGKNMGRTLNGHHVTFVRKSIVHTQVVARCIGRAEQCCIGKYGHMTNFTPLKR